MIRNEHRKAIFKQAGAIKHLEDKETIGLVLKWTRMENTQFRKNNRSKIKKQSERK